MAINSPKNGANINEADNQTFIYILNDKPKEMQTENQVSNNESLSTQFYSPLGEKQFPSSFEKDVAQTEKTNENLFETANFSFENISNSLNSNTNTELKKIISNEADSSWKKVEHFLNFDEDENLESNENDEFFSDISNKTTDETQVNQKEQTLNQPLLVLDKQVSYDGELNDYLNDENYKWNVEEYEDEGNYRLGSGSLKKSTQKEENEYDFANSLITLEYKPYNQFSTNIDFNGIYLSSSSLSLSLNSLSISIYYSTLNRFKYQSNITDKLIQISEFNFEETLKKLLNNYSAIFPHLLYSLLKGKISNHTINVLNKAFSRNFSRTFLKRIVLNDVLFTF